MTSFAGLLAALLLFLLAMPIAARSAGASSAFLILLSLVLIAGLRLAGSTTRVHLVLGVLALAGFLTWPLTGSRVHLVAGLCAVLAYLASATTTTVRHVARAQRVTTDVLLGAICGYLLLGLTFGVLFGLLEAASTEIVALSGTSSTSSAAVRLGELVYFSLVTLSSSGYGDIMPTGPAVRAVAPLVAVSGQLYLAILVARLVSVHVTQAAEVGTGE